MSSGGSDNMDVHRTGRNGAEGGRRRRDEVATPIGVSGEDLTNVML